MPSAGADPDYWLAEFVVREAVHLIDRQERDLDEVRRRAISMLGASALAAAVVGAAGIRRFDTFAGVLFVIGLASLGAATLVVVRLQFPVHRWVSGFSPSQFLDQLHKIQTLPPSEIMFRAARHLSDGADKNAGTLTEYRRRLKRSLVFGSINVAALLIATAWTVLV